MADESHILHSGNQTKPAGQERLAPGGPQQDAQAQLLSMLSNKQQYAWSWLRIWEQVTTNVLTVSIIGGAGVLATFLIQRVFNFVVVPTHWLIVVAIATVGILLTILVIALAVYLVMRKYPVASLVAMLAFFTAMTTEKNGFKTFTDALSRYGQAAKSEDTAPSSNGSNPTI